MWHVVKAAAKRAEISNLAPHDLRRSCARLCYVGGGELEQIQFLLGHASVQTTERYLGCKQKLTGWGWKTQSNPRFNAEARLADVLETSALLDRGAFVTVQTRNGSGLREPDFEGTENSQVSGIAVYQGPSL